MNDIEQFIRDAAAARGIDPDIAVKVAKSEGGIAQYAAHGDFDTGDSWWPFQLHYGGAGYEKYGTVAGMGTGFTALTGWQPADPRAWRDSVRYALNRAKASGWGAWYGAAHVGVGQWDGIDRNHPWDAAAERWDYEDGVDPMPAVIPFNPDATCDVQNEDWKCALESVQWLLRSIGRNPDVNDPVQDAWLIGELVPKIIGRDVGLKDASGRALAAWLNRTYGEEMGFTAHAADVEFADVLAGAGVNPTMIGGRRYGPAGHWVGVRRADENGWLELANPAPNYTQTGTHLDPREWAARGPWSAIYIDRKTVLDAQQPPSPPPPPPPPSIDWAAELRAILAADDREHGERLRAKILALLERTS